MMALGSLRQGIEDPVPEHCIPIPHAFDGGDEKDGVLLLNTEKLRSRRKSVSTASRRHQPSSKWARCSRSVGLFAPIVVAVVAVWFLVQALLFHHVLSLGAETQEISQRVANVLKSLSSTASSHRSDDVEPRPTPNAAAAIVVASTAHTASSSLNATSLSNTSKEDATLLDLSLAQSHEILPEPAVTADVTSEETDSDLTGVSDSANGLPVIDSSLWQLRNLEYSPDEEFQLTWEYNHKHKDWPYVGYKERIHRHFPQETYVLDRVANGAKHKKDDTEEIIRLSRHYYNLLAVFPGADEEHMHGILGRQQNGSLLLTPAPMPPEAKKAPGGERQALKNGGFYSALSNALPLDRLAPDLRDPVCKTVNYDVTALGDASIIITFFNEPLSTLLRSVHSVLNRTPPELVREIVLVDDHSTIPENAPGGPLDAYVRILPKMRLPERRGIVPARLAGARLSLAPVIVILDSHIEVSEGWLEPQLQRIKESPKSVVFPQIMSIDPVTFEHRGDSGIGFKWAMQERPYFGGPHDKPDAIASPTLAGGLFAVSREWFFEAGGYDDQFTMWGAENLEFAFRIWQCGGRVECAPCSKVYHIFRHGGQGYTSPSRSLTINRLRTARLWTDEYYPLAKAFIGSPANITDTDLGNFDTMLALKKRLQCKNFQWFLDTVDPEKTPRRVESVTFFKEIRKRGTERCLDNLQRRDPGETYGTFSCHGEGGSQSFLTVADAQRIHLAFDETSCLGSHLKFTDCNDAQKDNHWRLNIREGTLQWLGNPSDPQCLSLVGSSNELKLQPCDGSPETLWDMKELLLESYTPLQLSPEFMAHEERLKKRAESPTRL